ncbi:hypothetical protein [Nesterenkonia pannonica]|uniref:hypothetical protein n=1 Tax=Nesterenkonia pannonica TaxID=1548602 RepID=UPI00216421F9|nr:hypothetical protein [Nesterenkonia pannonica]
MGVPEQPTLYVPDDAGRAVLRFTYGPRQDWFDSAEQARLAEQDWQVTAQADRIGLRLAPDPDDEHARPLRRAKEDELPSEECRAARCRCPGGESGAVPQRPPGDHKLPGDRRRRARGPEHRCPAGPGTAVSLQPVDPDTLAPTHILEARP